MIVKSAKGDTPAQSTLFNGVSGNKMMDALNTERFTIIYQKYVKMTTPNNGAITGSALAECLRIYFHTTSGLNVNTFSHKLENIRAIYLNSNMHTYKNTHKLAHIILLFMMSAIF